MGTPLCWLRGQESLPAPETPSWLGYRYISHATYHTPLIYTHTHKLHTHTHPTEHTYYVPFTHITYYTHLHSIHIHPQFTIYTGHTTYHIYTSIIYILPPHTFYTCASQHTTYTPQTLHRLCIHVHPLHTLYIPTHICTSHIVYIFTHYIHMSYIYSKHTLYILQLYPYTCISCISTETTTHIHTTRMNTYIPYMPKS